MQNRRLKQVQVASLLLALASLTTAMLMSTQSSSKAIPSAPDSNLTQVPPRPLTPRTTPPRNPQYGDKAVRDIQKAREKAFSVQFLSNQTSSQAATDITSIAQQTLRQAESSYAASRFLTAEKQAKAANALYEAAKTLYEGKLGYVSSPRGSKAPSKRWLAAPYRVQEHIARAEAAIRYYQVNDTTAMNLLQRAKQLADSASAINPAQVPDANNLATLANYRASEHLANAVVHLVEAQRGF
jgi:hypothetical protein